MKLTRDPSSGKILDNGTPIALRGGHFDLFEKDGTPERGLFKPGETLPFTVSYSGAPCQTNSFPVQALKWDPEPWTQLFSHVKNFAQCNLMRIWLTGGTRTVGNFTNPEPVDLNPFLKTRGGSQWKFKVYEAVEQDIWNEDYFRRLRKFAELADQNGIALQVTLFNYVDVVRRFDNAGFRGWCRSPWNPTMCLPPANDHYWGNTHLVNPAVGPDDLDEFFCLSTDPPRPSDPREKDRHTFFLDPPNRLRVAQKAFVWKVIRTLSGLGNIIFEIMNEPRGSHRQLTYFNSKVIEWIFAFAGSWRPLISVNALSLEQLPGVPAGTPPAIFDIDWWKDRASSIQYYDKVDIISYHGITGYPPVSYYVCDREHSIPLISTSRPQMRLNAQEQRHGSKALMFSTDAAGIRGLAHSYPDAARPSFIHEMNVREGQIDTNLPNNTTDAPQAQRIRSDLQNWAYWCLSTGVGNKLGKVHFQNHSGFQMTYRRIRDAFQEATANPLGAVPPESD